MALVLRESDVRRLLDMNAVIQAVEGAMRERGEGIAQNEPRRRVFSPGGVLNVMFASYPGAGVSGVKSYSVGSSGVNFLVLLYGEDGSLQALLEADTLGAYRTGAATAVAARAFHERRPVRAALIGAGHQAETQALAISRVLELTELRVYSRTPERRAAFAESVSYRSGVRAVASSTAREAIEGADLVVCITTSPDPVLDADWIKDGALVVGAGSNYPNRAELPPELFRGATVLVDQLDAARLESGDLHRAVDAGAFSWHRAVELSAILAGRAAFSPAQGRVTVFESHGLALWDVAAAATVVARAKVEGVGEEIRLFG